MLKRKKDSAIPVITSCPSCRDRRKITMVTETIDGDRLKIFRCHRCGHEWVIRTLYRPIEHLEISLGVMNPGEEFSDDSATSVIDISRPLRPVT